MFRRKASAMAMILAASLCLSNMSPMWVMADEVSAESEVEEEGETEEDGSQKQDDSVNADQEEKGEEESEDAGTDGTEESSDESEQETEGEPSDSDETTDPSDADTDEESGEETDEFDETDSEDENAADDANSGKSDADDAKEDGGEDAIEDEEDHASGESDEADSESKNADGAEEGFGEAGGGAGVAAAGEQADDLTDGKDEDPAAKGAEKDQAAESEDKDAEQSEEAEIVYTPISIDEGLVDESGQGAANAGRELWDADKILSLPVLPTDVDTASDGCVMLGIPGEYIADQQAVIDRINEIRREACQEGVTNPDTNMPLTMDDYVELHWSHELERIARIRAAETGLTAEHIRTNGEEWNSVTTSLRYVGECAAWNYSTSATSGIEQWYGEKSKWMETQDLNKAGHYTTIIRPSMHYVGFGTFYTPYTYYPNTTVAEFTTEEGLDQSFVDITGECLQKIEVAEKFLSGSHAIQGTLEGVKGEESSLLLTTTLNMDTSLTNGVFSYVSDGICCLDGVNWSSDNTNIASVSSDGQVTAKGCGSCTITADAGSGISAETTFTVNHVEETIPAVEPTCTDPGLTAGTKCANCGEILKAQETVPATGHSLSGWEVTKDATCTEKGLKERRCSNCEYVETEEIPATGHSMSNWKVTEDATCTEKGLKERSCSNCEYVETEEINALGHTWNEESNYTVDEEPTCTKEGTESIHCAICDEIREGSSHTIAALGHNWNKTYTVDEEPTCIKEGAESIHCSVCNESKEGSSRTIAALGHKWNKTYTVDEEPTYTKEGVESIHCAVCGEIKDGSERAIAKLTKPISGCSVKGIVSKTYTGRPVTQKVTVADGGSVLTEGVDYKVSYRTNTNAGKAYVVITGMGKYRGKAEKAFDITKAANKITAGNVTRTYSAKKAGFSIGAKATGGKLTYKSNKSAVKVDKNGKVTIAAKFSGTAKITITAGDANYATVSKTVTVSVPKVTKLSSVKNSDAKKITVKWKKNSLASGYQIQYGLKSSFKGAKKVTVSKNTTVSKDIKGLKQGKKYYVRIRCYKKVGSKKFYSAWSARKAVTIKE